MFRQPLAAPMNWFRRGAVVRDATSTLPWHRLAVVIWTIGFVGSFAASRLLADRINMNVAWPLLIASSIVGVVAMGLIDRRTPGWPQGFLASSRVSVRAPRLLAMEWLVAAIGLGMCLYAAYMIAVWRAAESAKWVWELGLLLLVLGFAVAERSLWRRPQLSRRLWAEIALVGFLVVLCAALRFPQLEAIPRQLDADEMSVGMEVRRFHEGKIASIFATSWYDIPTMSFAIQSLPSTVMGESLLALRTASALQGISSVVLLYLLARTMFGIPVAGIAAFILAVAHWEVHFSRSGINYMQAQMIALATMYVFVLGLKTRRPLFFLLTGMLVGMCLITYYAGRLIPVLLLATLALWFVQEPGRLSRSGIQLFSLAIGFIAFFAPMVPAFASNPNTFTSRTNTIFMGTADPRFRHDRTPAQWLGDQTGRALVAFHVGGDASRQYGPRGPLMDVWAASLLAMGALYVLCHLRDVRFFLIAAWVVLTLVFGSILTVDHPQSHRLIVIPPALALLVALGLDAGRRGLNALARSSVPGVALVVFVMGCSLAANSYDYFVTYADTRPTNPYSGLARYLREHAKDYEVVLISDIREVSLTFVPIQYVAPGLKAQTIATEDLTLPVPQADDTKGVLFIVDFADKGDAAERIKSAYPAIVEQVHENEKGTKLFRTLLATGESG